VLQRGRRGRKRARPWVVAGACDWAGDSQRAGRVLIFILVLAAVVIVQLDRRSVDAVGGLVDEYGGIISERLARIGERGVEDFVLLALGLGKGGHGGGGWEQEAGAVVAGCAPIILSRIVRFTPHFTPTRSWRVFNQCISGTLGTSASYKTTFCCSYRSFCPDYTLLQKKHNVIVCS
jgi:hypothetical protein